MSFTDQKPFIATTDDIQRKWGVGRIRRGFLCKLCGHNFQAGDTVRWIYANGTPGQQTGNFFVCAPCDTGNADCMAKAKESLSLAVKLAKQWGIYGPDWEDAQQFKPDHDS